MHFIERLMAMATLGLCSVGEVPSQYFLSEFITVKEEDDLIRCIEAAPRPKWTNLSNRSLQNWGGLPGGRNGKDGPMLEESLPEWLSQWCQRLQETLVLPGEGDEGSVPLFPAVPNHVLVNKYLPSQGIMAHEDGPLYHPVVAMINVGSGLLFDVFQRDESGDPTHHQCVWMEQRSLWVMTDSVYHDYLHGVASHDADPISLSNWPINSALLTPTTQQQLQQATNGDPIPRQVRYSLTFRLVLNTRKMPKGLLNSLMKR